MTCITPIRLKHVDKISGEEVIEFVPCGKCEGCLKQLQSAWITRLLGENLFSKSSFFITLTYDTAHLPLPIGVCKPDIQKFMKRLRHEKKCRVFGVSEYGGIHGRPHYHACLFFDEKLSIIELSYILSRTWKLGNHNIGYVDISSISYVAKYCLKPKKDPTGLYIAKTFAFMSKKPGLGLTAFDNIAQEIIDSPKFEVSVAGQGCFALPRYLRDKFKSDQQKAEYRLEIQEKYKPFNMDIYEQNEMHYKRITFEQKQKDM